MLRRRLLGNALAMCYVQAEGNPQRMRAAAQRRDHTGATPYSVATQLKHDAVAQLLLNA